MPAKSNSFLSEIAGRVGTRSSAALRGPSPVAPGGPASGLFASSALLRSARTRPQGDGPTGKSAIKQPHADFLRPLFLFKHAVSVATDGPRAHGPARKQTESSLTREKKPQPNKMRLFSRRTARRAAKCSPCVIGSASRFASSSARSRTRLCARLVLDNYPQGCGIRGIRHKPAFAADPLASSWRREQGCLQRFLAVCARVSLSRPNLSAARPFLQRARPRRPPTVSLQISSAVVSVRQPAASPWPLSTCLSLRS